MSCSKTILVTGGTGLVGNAIRFVSNDYINKYNFVFVSSKQYNLTNMEDTKKMFEEAEEGIKYLQRGRFAVLLASRLYSAILDKVIENDFNVLNKRAKTSFLEKVVIMIKTFFIKNKIYR
jgi:FlaA1/EpsC-like NDP-sugar epimerase